jgi:hypothetical protein
VVGIEGELQRFVAKYVARELEKPHVAAAREIDVSKAIDAAWASIGPREESDSSGKRPPGGATADLNQALEQEIRDHEAVFLAEGQEPAEASEELG